MNNKNCINDYIINYDNRAYKWYELIQLIEYKIGLRNSIILLVGEEGDDNSFRNYIIDNLDSYILIKEGIAVISKNLDEARNGLEIAKEYDETKLGLFLNYPKCCVEKFNEFKNSEDAAIHASMMRNIFKHLSYFPCSENCKQSIEREKRLSRIIWGEIGHNWETKDE